MDIGRIMSFLFGIIFIIVLYCIIYYSLKIMYKDVKGGKKGRRKKSSVAHGLEIIQSTQTDNLRQGSIIPVRQTLTIGRKDDNDIVLMDEFISGYHAKIFIKNNSFYIEDLESTNGTFVNEKRIDDRVKLEVNDEIRLGNIIFKVID